MGCPIREPRKTGRAGEYRHDRIVPQGLRTPKVIPWVVLRQRGFGVSTRTACGSFFAGMDGSPCAGDTDFSGLRARLSGPLDGIAASGVLRKLRHPKMAAAIAAFTARTH